MHKWMIKNPSWIIPASFSERREVWSWIICIHCKVKSSYPHTSYILFHYKVCPCFVLNLLLLIIDNTAIRLFKWNKTKRFFYERKNTFSVMLYIFSWFSLCLDLVWLMHILLRTYFKSWDCKLDMIPIQYLRILLKDFWWNRITLLIKNANERKETHPFQTLS